MRVLPHFRWPTVSLSTLSSRFRMIPTDRLNTYQPEPSSPRSSFELLSAVRPDSSRPLTSPSPPTLRAERPSPPRSARTSSSSRSRSSLECVSLQLACSLAEATGTDRLDTCAPQSGGISKILPIGSVSDEEKKLLEACIPELEGSIAKVRPACPSPLSFVRPLTSTSAFPPSRRVPPSSLRLPLPSSDCTSPLPLVVSLCALDTLVLHLPLSLPFSRGGFFSLPWCTYYNVLFMIRLLSHESAPSERSGKQNHGYVHRRRPSFSTRDLAPISARMRSVRSGGRQVVRVTLSVPRIGLDAVALSRRRVDVLPLLTLQVVSLDSLVPL